eukprot:366244-Chlamydomonas_euryale.AAC.9
MACAMLKRGNPWCRQRGMVCNGGRTLRAHTRGRAACRPTLQPLLPDVHNGSPPAHASFCCRFIGTLG